MLFNQRAKRLNSRKSICKFKAERLCLQGTRGEPHILGNLMTKTYVRVWQPIQFYGFHFKLVLGGCLLLAVGFSTARCH